MGVDDSRVRCPFDRPGGDRERHPNVARGLDTHVWWSVSRDECVKVDPPERGTCEDLPERYRKIPVQ